MSTAYALELVTASVALTPLWLPLLLWWWPL